ncbi:hypothetical protein NA57DRAFT_75061 [Rhizodiscina lignyota]|uniref:Clr5 domain-containing protein n=1 Tax=Rhizodiscina lignyota TaxID=1504668 RepID=A0A9P4IDF9_9PEZI|nr:hypothetical protein NA57DRAFT_75061 [Rhizodiscina lignyota]
MGRKYTTREWDARKDLIKELYWNQRRPIKEVCSALHTEGFEVSERMLRHRIKQWKLDRKNKESEMRTAIQLLIDSGITDWSEKEPKFRIRHCIVPLHEVLHYFYRRGISDPFGWLKGLPEERCQPSPDVELMIEESPVSPVASDSGDSIESSLSTTEDVEHRDGEIQSILRPEKCSLQQWHKRSRIPFQLGAEAALPLEFRLNEELIWHAASYCSRYLQSPQAMSDSEWAVHMLTTHGTFGAQMQDGIFFAPQHNPHRAFAHFNNAFEMAHLLLSEESPFAFAQVFTVMCELATHSEESSRSQRTFQERAVLQEVNQSLIKYLSDLAAIRLSASHPLVAFLSALRKAEHISDSIVRLMRKMIDIFTEENSEMGWKKMYLKERYCDCLYYTGISGERQALRLQLLEEQEAFYGKVRGNVLYTLTNVAEDCLENFQTAKAEALYRDAIDRANTNRSGFARSKIRFAALEGLAKVAIMNVDLDTVAARLKCNSVGITQDLQRLNGIKLRRLNEAAGYLEQAEDEARVWFCPTNRRTIRIGQMRQRVLKEILDLEISCAETSERIW